ncbi:MAG: PTS lactose/cellobiose transporter subunit IIA [Erysipelotrichaceae bacterium]|nr:PTS lactose/cellobiose transporter subunit IIA [Erysipelotrichaceae bacterium]
MDQKLEELIFTTIANAGESRSDSKAAIEAAKAGNYEDAENYLKQADEAMLIAHQAHTEILYQSMNSAEMPMTFLMAHASNHLSEAETTRDLADVYLSIIKEVRKINA